MEARVVSYLVSAVSCASAPYGAISNQTGDKRHKDKKKSKKNGFLHPEINFATKRAPNLGTRGLPQRDRRITTPNHVFTPECPKAAPFPLPARQGTHCLELATNGMKIKRKYPKKIAPI